VPPAAVFAAAVVAAAAALAARGDPPASVEQVRALQLRPEVFAPAAPRERPAIRVDPSVAPARPAPDAAWPPVQVPRVGSVAVGRPNRGRLVNGLQLPARGLYWVTWDPILRRVPNRGSRRWATDRMISFLVTVLRDFRIANPTAPPVLVGDLSRPFGGRFGREYGGLGHASHQNGLDADVYYPRVDRALRAPKRPQEVDRVLAQDLVDRFVAWGARFTFVGLRVGLRGPRWIVQAIPHHDDHLHVRIANVTR
jgi:hypothetical protein